MICQAVAIADDTTGALEVGALFAQEGIRSLVTSDRERGLERLAGSTPALVVNSESRHMPAVEARACLRRIGEQCRDRGIPFLYKKTDSTLRGNIAAEFDGLRDAFPGRPVVFVPGYPRLGRTVIGGILRVEGVPIAETAFARDPRNPIRDSSVLNLFESAVPVTSAAALLDKTDSHIYVCDSATEEDVEAVAAVTGSQLVASPAGFARYWARRLPIRREPAPPRPRAGSALVVCGSLHPRSREQVANFRTDERWQTISTGSHRPGAEQAAAEALAQQVAEVYTRFDALIVFGGDTAHAILRALGCTDVEPLGEAVAGVPVSLIRPAGRPVLLATKAGGFGPPDVLARIRAKLEGE